MISSKLNALIANRETDLILKMELNGRAWGLLMDLKKKKLKL